MPGALPRVALYTRLVTGMRYQRDVLGRHGVGGLLIALDPGVQVSPGEGVFRPDVLTLVAMVRLRGGRS